MKTLSTRLRWQLRWPLRLAVQVGGSLVLVFILSRASGPSVRADAAVTLPTPVIVELPALAAGDGFGSSVALHGDVMVVGAVRTTVNGNEQQGAAYIFQRDPADPGRFVFVKQVTASDGVAFYLFGGTVAVYGDTVVVAALPRASPDNHFQAGAAYVFERNHGGSNHWGQVAKLVDENFDDEYSRHGYLGESIAIHGDTIVLGAPRQYGRAFIFGRNQGGANQWGEVQVIGPPNGWELGEFGEALAFDGQLLVVGGSRANMVPPIHKYEGAAFVLQHNGTKWVHVAKLAVADDDPDTPYGNDSRFGNAVALVGSTIYVGASAMTRLDPGNNPANDLENIGEVYVFEQNGDPSQWEHVATLIAGDGLEYEHFGHILYATADGVFISSSKGPNDTVYFFRNRPAQGEASAQAVGAAQSWEQVYSFTLSEDEALDANFGANLDAGGNTLVVSASGIDDGRGVLYTYPLDVMVAVQPDDDPDDDPDVPATVAYLPVIASRSLPAYQPTGILANGGVLEGPNGVKVGALAASLPEPAGVTIAATGAPPTGIPFGVTTHGSYYYLGAERDLSTPIQEPLLVGFPVPAGADPAHLALAVLAPVYEEGADGEPYWDFLDGLYDSEQGLFLTTLFSLHTDGDTFVLAEHPDFSSPPNGAAVAAEGAGTRVGVFTAQCKLFAFKSDCTSETETLVAGYLNDIYLRMSGPLGFTKFPYLRSPLGHIFMGNTNSLDSFQGFTARISPDAFASECRGSVVGAFEYSLARLYLCLDPAEGVTAQSVYILIHEYFHATQYGYAAVQQDADAGKLKPWIMEGMATAAEESYFEDGEMIHSNGIAYRPPQRVDISLETGEWRDATKEEYSSQDFWEYVGQRSSRGLDYLEPILQNGGATTDGVIAALENEFGIPFHELYWGWVKNQVFEKVFDLNGSLGARCQLTEGALTGGFSPIVWDYLPGQRGDFPWDADWEAVDPLHAQVVEINFPHDMTGAIINVELQRCQDLFGDAQIACRLEAQKLLHSKIYVQGEANCEADLADILPLEGFRHLTDLSQSKRYFVVVANTDREDVQLFSIGIEPQYQ